MLYKCISYTHPSDKLAHTNTRRRWNLPVIVVLAEELTLMVTYLLTTPLSPKSLCRMEIKSRSLFAKEWPATDHLHNAPVSKGNLACVCCTIPSAEAQLPVTTGGRESLNYILLYDGIILFYVATSDTWKASLFCLLSLKYAGGDGIKNKAGFAENNPSQCITLY